MVFIQYIAQFCRKKVYQPHSNNIDQLYNNPDTSSVRQFFFVRDGPGWSLYIFFNRPDVHGQIDMVGGGGGGSCTVEEVEVRGWSASSSGPHVLQLKHCVLLKGQTSCNSRTAGGLSFMHRKQQAATCNSNTIGGPTIWVVYNTNTQRLATTFTT